VDDMCDWRRRSRFMFPDCLPASGRLSVVSPSRHVTELVATVAVDAESVLLSGISRLSVTLLHLDEYLEHRIV